MLIYCKLHSISSQLFFFLTTHTTPFHTSSQLKAASKGHFIWTGTVPWGNRVKSNCFAGVLTALSDPDMQIYGTVAACASKPFRF